MRPRRPRPWFHSRLGSPRPRSDTKRRAASSAGTRGTGSPPLDGDTPDTSRHWRQYSTSCHSRESMAIGSRRWGATRMWGMSLRARASVFQSSTGCLVRWMPGSDLARSLSGWQWVCPGWAPTQSACLFSDGRAPQFPERGHNFSTNTNQPAWVGQTSQFWDARRCYLLLHNVTNDYNQPARRLESRSSVTCGLLVRVLKNCYEQSKGYDHCYHNTPQSKKPWLDKPIFG